MKAGMSVDELEQVIVFNDEMLDPLKPNAHEYAWDLLHGAASALRQAGSVRFEMMGTWTGDCGPWKYGPAAYEIGNFGDDYSEGLVRFQDGDGNHFLMASSKYWQKVGGTWEMTSREEIFQDTAWRDWDTSPIRALRTMLGIPSDVEMTIVEGNDGYVTLSAEIPYELPEAQISMTIARDSYQIDAYSMTFGRPECRHTTEAWDGENGIEIEIPEEIREAGSSS